MVASTPYALFDVLRNRNIPLTLPKTTKSCKLPRELTGIPAGQVAIHFITSTHSMRTHDTYTQVPRSAFL